MSHHYINQLIHVMWSTHDQKYRFSKEVKNELQAYISGIVKSLKGIVFATGGAEDHIHILFNLPADLSLSNFMKNIKANSSRWLKTQKKVVGEFSWQTGFTAISVQKDRLRKVCEYISSDESRHESKSYADELLTMLNQQSIAFNERFYLHNSHSKIYVHTIWSTHCRMPYLSKEVTKGLYAKMTEVVISSWSCSRGGRHRRSCSLINRSPERYCIIRFG